MLCRSPVSCMSHSYVQFSQAPQRTPIYRQSLGSLSRINRSALGPSTSPQQLTSASVEPSETASAPDEFYKPRALYSALKQPTPTPPKAPYNI